VLSFCWVERSAVFGCYHEPFRQLISRIDDALHARLKARAAADGRSMNGVVVEALEVAVGGKDERAEI